MYEASHYLWLVRGGRKVLVQDESTHRLAWVKTLAHIPVKGEEARGGLHSQFRVLPEPDIHPETAALAVHPPSTSTSRDPHCL